MKSNKGFSLVELIVVIAIMAIIAAVAIPVYSTYVDKAESGVAQQAIDDAEHAIKLAVIEYDVTVVSATSGTTVTYTISGANAEKAAEQVGDIIDVTETKVSDTEYTVAVTVKTLEDVTVGYTNS